MRVIGTAGHVDHGKSTLVESLTGINPDRLREEQEREMTIDLGFAWLDLPSGQTVGVVDVPGHIDFIENMLAGVGGIDAALLVIAADEGVMPQTREHLAILELLGIDKAVVALTKIDLVEEAGWLNMVEDDVRSLLDSTSLAEAPIVRVSARTKDGLDVLAAALDSVAAAAPARVDLGRPRLSIDRAFTIAGFGTVVTGTLLGGSFSVGEEIEVVPSGLKGRIRGLQTHRTPLDVVRPGSRVAINLAGVDVDSLSRGDAIVLPGTVKGTSLLDAHVRQLADVPRPLRHNDQVKVFLGAAQRMGKVRVLGQAKSVRPGSEGWLQIVLDQPVAAAKADRYILRRPSPPMTLGGGQVVDAHPKRRHRLKDPVVIQSLEAAFKGTPEEQLETVIRREGILTLAEAAASAGMGLEAARIGAETLIASQRIRVVSGGDLGEESSLVSESVWRDWSRAVLGALANYHQAEPMRSGMPQEMVKSQLGVDQEGFAALLEDLVARNEIEHDPPELRLPGFSVRLDPKQEALADELLALFTGNKAPPSMKEAVAHAGEGVVRHLLREGKLVAVSRDVLLGRQMYEEWLASVQQVLEAGQTLTVAQVRDRFGSSRKYVLAFMEHLDAEGITLRQGDVRRLNPARKP
jgi:selenocysteine-specific elongation factor